MEKITSEAALEKFLGRSPSLPHVILFSEKDPSTLYQALSMKFEGKVVLGQVKKGVAAVAAKYEVENFPALVTIKGDAVEPFAGIVSFETGLIFVGDLGKEGLIKHIEQVASGVKAEAKEAKEEKVEKKVEKKPKKELKPVQEVKSVEELTAYVTFQLFCSPLKCLQGNSLRHQLCWCC